MERSLYTRRGPRARLLGFALGLSSTLLAAQEAPSFHRDVSPLLQRHCESCHRPGEAAPFPLQSYRDASKRARQLAEVTASGFMPPWLPGADSPPLVGDRRLTPDEIRLLADWAAAGAPEGDPADAPARLTFPEGWQLGPPDLVVTMAEPYLLAAEGRDLYRNFVLPAPAKQARWVKAVEIRPENRAVVHHAVLFVDRTPGSRQRDAAEPLAGFESMGPGTAKNPDGLFVGWAPGKIVDPPVPGVAWSLDERTDLVLQLHLRPTGKPEEVRASIGLYFADEPPTRHPVAIRLASNTIDIPAGVGDYLVRDEYVLPVDVTLHAVYPHAHYLATDMHAFAVDAAGERQTLIHIPAWDFNWQDQYNFRQPLQLAAGTTVAFEYRYDNTAENPLNPSRPPRRVRYGEQSTDEMAELLLQVETQAGELGLLWRDFAWKAHQDQTRYLEERVAAAPQDPQMRAALGDFLLRGRRYEEALEQFRALTELAPGRPGPLYQLGHALLVAGRASEALAPLKEGIRIAPRIPELHIELGRAHFLLQEYDAAERELEPLVRAGVKAPKAFLFLGDVKAARGRCDEAEPLFRRVLELDPESTRALRALASCALGRGDTAAAVEHLGRALSIFPDDAEAHFLLGSARERQGSSAEAARHYSMAARLEPDNDLYRERAER